MINANCSKFLRTAFTGCVLLIVAIHSKAQDSSIPEITPAMRVVVRLLADDTYQVGSTTVKASELTLALKVLAGLPEKPTITVKLDEGVSYDRVVKILDACREANLTHLAFIGPSKEKPQ